MSLLCSEAAHHHGKLAMCWWSRSDTLSRSTERQLLSCHLWLSCRDWDIYSPASMKQTHESGLNQKSPPQWVNNTPRALIQTVVHWAVVTHFLPTVHRWRPVKLMNLFLEYDTTSVSYSGHMWLTTSTSIWGCHIRICQATCHQHQLEAGVTRDVTKQNKTTPIKWRLSQYAHIVHSLSPIQTRKSC